MKKIFIYLLIFNSIKANEDHFFLNTTNNVIEKLKGISYSLSDTIQAINIDTLKNTSQLLIKLIQTQQKEIQDLKREITDIKKHKIIRDTISKKEGFNNDMPDVLVDLINEY